VAIEKGETSRNKRILGERGTSSKFDAGCKVRRLQDAGGEPLQLKAVERGKIVSMMRRRHCDVMKEIALNIVKG